MANMADLNRGRFQLLSPSGMQKVQAPSAERLGLSSGSASAPSTNALGLGRRLQALAARPVSTASTGPKAAASLERRVTGSTPAPARLPGSVAAHVAATTPASKDRVLRTTSPARPSRGMAPRPTPPSPEGLSSVEALRRQTSGEVSVPSSKCLPSMVQQLHREGLMRSSLENDSGRTGSRPAAAPSNGPLPLRGAAAAAASGSSTSALEAGAAEAVRSSTAMHESRIASMENKVKSFDKMLRDYTPVDASALEVEVLHRCQALVGELDEQRNTRLALEEKAKRLGKLLVHEREEREAWLVAFLQSLHATLQELTVCIDRSISDSNQLMKHSMDGTDEVMHHLIDRVDQLLIQKESELAPLLEQDGHGLEAS